MDRLILERAGVNTEGGSGYPRLGQTIAIHSGCAKWSVRVKRRYAREIAGLARVGNSFGTFVMSLEIVGLGTCKKNLSYRDKNMKLS